MAYKDPERKKEASRQYYLKNRDRIRTRQKEASDPIKKHASHIKRKYDLSKKDYDFLLLVQKNCCAICERPAKLRRMHVDHNHETGKVRGLLCYGCNASLGHLEKNFNKFLEYLK